MTIRDRIPILSRLRDPIWQSIGALLTLAAIVIATVVAYDIYLRSRKPYDAKKLSIAPGGRLEVLTTCFKTPLAERLDLLLDQKPLTTLSARFAHLQNSGDSPILPEDFEEPLRVRADHPWQLVEVAIQESKPKGIRTEWSAIDDGVFELSPLLLNPGDELTITSYATLADEEADPCTVPNLNWSGRIVGVRSFARTLERESSVPALLKPEIRLRGWSPYYVVALASALVMFSLGIGWKSRRLAIRGFSTFVLLLGVAIASFATAEIVVSYFSRSAWWSGSAVILALHLLLTWYIAWPRRPRRLAKDEEINTGRE